MQQLQPLRLYLIAQRGHACHVTARSVEAGDETALHRIDPGDENNRSRHGRHFDRGRCGGFDDDHGYFTTNQLSRDPRYSVFDQDILIVDASLPKTRAERRHRGFFGCSAGNKSDDRQRWLLRPRRQRPRRRAAKPRDELPPSHSITSSASASMFGGIVRASALAVFRLTTNSNL